MQQSHGWRRCGQCLLPAQWEMLHPTEHLSSVLPAPGCLGIRDVWRWEDVWPHIWRFWLRLRFAGSQSILKCITLLRVYMKHVVVLVSQLLHWVYLERPLCSFWMRKLVTMVRTGFLGIKAYSHLLSVAQAWIFLQEKSLPNSAVAPGMEGHYKSHNTKAAWHNNLPLMLKAHYSEWLFMSLLNGELGRRAQCMVSMERNCLYSPSGPKSVLNPRT